MEIFAKENRSLNLTAGSRGALNAPAGQSDRNARVFVWGVWLVMTLAALVCLVIYARNIPLTEDWLLVPALTGHEPDLVSWLWEQNNEHRIPFPRLILLALLKLTHGDFRAGMVFNVISLAALAFVMIRVVRSLPGGRTRYLDAFFAVALLNLGNWENLFWSWQLTQLVPTFLTCVVLLVLVRDPTFTTAGAAVAAGLGLVLLPLCGANGLLFVPILAVWIGYCGVFQWRAAKEGNGRRWLGAFLIGSALAALGLTSLYFVGYERPAWTPPNPGIVPSLVTALQFQTLGFGPAVRSSWTLPALMTVGVLLSSGALALLAVARANGLERHRAIGVLLFFGNTVLFALAMGWGRAGVIPIYGFWPLRYVLLAVPAFFTAFFIWELFGPAKIRTLVQAGLFCAVLILVPFNTRHGLWWRDWYAQGAERVEQDLEAGTPPLLLAEHNREFLFHSMEPGRLADLIRMLRDAGMTPFAAMKEEPMVTVEFRYYQPEAEKVVLAWGVNGWNVVADELRPAGTVIDRVMRTPMTAEGGVFVARVPVFAGTSIDYGFLVTEERNGVQKAVWDGKEEYRKVALADSMVEVKLNAASAKAANDD